MKCPYHEKAALSEAPAVIEPELDSVFGLLPRVFVHLLKTRGNLGESLRRNMIRVGKKFFRIRVLGVDLTLSADPAHARHLLLERSQDFPKTAWERRVLSPAMEGGLIILEGEEWRQHHRVLAKCFSTTRIARLPVLVSDACRTRMARWSGSVEISHQMKCLVNEVITRYFLDGYAIRDVDVYSRAFDRVEKYLETRVFSPSLLLRPWTYWTYRRELGYVEAELREGIRRGSDDETPLGVMRGELGSDQLALEEIRTLSGAGMTTAHLLTWIVQLLALHPEVQERLSDEVAAVGSDEISASDLERMAVLDSVIQEGLRLYPPAPFLFRVHRDPGLRKYFLTSVWAMHRHPDHWGDPESFKPDRWLGADVHPEGAFMPFGLGARVCIGRRFALLEAKGILYEMIRRFRIELPRKKIAREIVTILTRSRGKVRVDLIQKKGF